MTPTSMILAMMCLLAATVVDCFFAPSLNIGEVSMANIFKQYKDSRTSAGLFTEPGSFPSALQSTATEGPRAGALDLHINGLDNTSVPDLRAESLSAGISQTADTDASTWDATLCGEDVVNQRAWGSGASAEGPDFEKLYTRYFEM